MRFMIVFAAAIVASAAVHPSSYGLQATAQDGAGIPAELTVQKVKGGKVFADAKGLTLYTFDRDQPGKSTCDGPCERTWSPVRAPALANASMGEWSAIRRDDGTRQWAYGGKPLYTFARDTKAGDVGGDGTDNIWHVAMLPLPPIPPAPEGVTAQIADSGRVFADAKGLTLYIYDRDTEPGKSSCVEACADAWPPLPASADAKPPVDWTVIGRDDGSKQWAYKGKPLYRFSRDAQAGDTVGDGVANIWHALKL